MRSIRAFFALCKRVGVVSIITVTAGMSGLLAPAAIAEGAQPLTSPAVTEIIGENTGGMVGYDVSSAGDVNGDGYDDVLIGAPTDATGGFQAGAVYLVYGPVSDGLSLDAAAAKFTGESANDGLGFQLASGDINGDGYSDILFSSSGNDALIDGGGAVYLFYGGVDADLLSGEYTVSDADARFLGTIEKEYAGYSLASAGDVNADGYDDILIGAFANDVADIDAGAAYLLYGAASLIGDISLDTADATFYGVHRGDYAGISVSCSGDVNADGYDDVLIGAYGTGDNGRASGTVYLVYGNTTLTGAMNLENSDVRFPGAQHYDYAGEDVAIVGDVNGDGYDDMLISAPRHQYTPGSAGTTYLVYGRAFFPSEKSLKMSDVKFRNPEETGRVDMKIAGAGDMNADGLDDLLIATAGRYTRGQVFIVLGSTSLVRNFNLNTADQIYRALSEVEFAGMSVAGAGDVNGDGRADMLVGAPYSNQGGYQSGAAYLEYSTF